MDKCFYCHSNMGDKVVQAHTGKETVSLPYCSELCKQELIHFGERREKYGQRLNFINRCFLGAVTLLFLIRAFIQHENLFISYLLSAALVIEGATFLLFPFPKFSECSFWGVKRSKLVLQVGACILIIWATWIIYATRYIFGSLNPSF
jgi:Na+/citrate or Na+/malate symporter